MLTQSIVSPAKVAVDQMKLAFNGMYCDADVETLMQIGADDDGDEVSDGCRLAAQDDCEKSKNENLKKKPVNDEFNAVSKQKRKSRRGRKKSSRQQPYKPQVQVPMSRRQRLRRRSHLAAAPDNTTQFLMSDQEPAASTNYSDSDMESDAENDFAKREFSKEYEKIASNKQKLPITKLIEEYFMYETEVKDLEKKYNEMTAQEQLKARLGTVEYDWEKGEVAMEPEVAEKIRIFHEEISKIREENRFLEDQNLRLRDENRSYHHDSDTSSSSSDSSSSGSDSSSDSDESSSSEDDDESDEEIETENNEPTSTGEAVVNNLNCADLLEQRKDDTGYESSGSSNDVTRVTSTTFRK